MPLLRSGRPNKYLKTPAWRPVVSLVLAGTAWVRLSYAQGTGTTGAAKAPAPAAPAAAEEPAPVRPALPTAGTTPQKTDPVPGTGTTPKASPFDLPPPATPEEQKLRSPFSRPATGASSIFGTRQNPDGTTATDATGADTDATGGSKPIDAPTTFSAPGFYGGGGVSLTTGTGRLARPREKWSITAGMGFDDNTLQAPTEGGGTDDVVFRQVIPELPEISTNGVTQVQTGTTFFNGNFVPVFRTVNQKIILRPFQPEREVVQVFPGVPDRERDASVISSMDASYQAQWTKGRKAFTMDARAGVDYYWSRDTDPLEYEASVSLLYIRRLSSRTQLSTALTASHQTQPDFQRVNAFANAGTNIASTFASSKTDLSYRWDRRFSTVTSLSADIRKQGTTEVGSSSGQGSFTQFGLGQELRYLWSPKLTYVGEVRYTAVDYMDVDSSNTTVSILAGADWDLTRRLRATTRVGQAIRTFQPTGVSSGSPYGEVSLAYQPARRDSLTFSSRYGFEESSIPGAQQLVFRTSASWQHLFSPKLVASAAVNNISYETKAAGSAGAGSAQDVLDGSLNLRYFYSRKLKFGTSYNYTSSKTDLGFSDYYKNRIFFTGEYEF